MLPPDEESDRFLIAKDLKLVGYRRDKFVFCYVVRSGPFWSSFTKSTVKAGRDEGRLRAHCMNSILSRRHKCRTIEKAVIAQ